MYKALRVPVILALAIALLSLPAATQQRVERDSGGGGAATGGQSFRQRTAPGRSSSIVEGGEFTFARAVYDSPGSPYNWWFGGAWRVDYPEADEHFVTGISEWVGTNLNVSPHPVHLRLTDERLFDYPMTYLVEPGHMELTEDEVASLREYLLRGGFLFLDDFHGDYEWERVKRQMKQVFPEYEIKDLPQAHPIFHSYLDINEVVQVPGVASLVNGVTYEKGGVTPHYMGIENKDGRLMVFMTRNCDLGDAWEWINDSRYPVKYGLMAYRIGINVIVYAMTH